MTKVTSTDRLFTFEKVLKVFGGEVVAIGETDEQEIYFWTGGHFLEHGHELVTVDPATFPSRFHRIEFLHINHEQQHELDISVTNQSIKL